MDLNPANETVIDRISSHPRALIADSLPAESEHLHRLLARYLCPQAPRPGHVSFTFHLRMGAGQPAKSLCGSRNAAAAIRLRPTAGFGNDLAAPNGVAALHQHFTGVGISGDIAVRVPNQNQVAVALELIAGIVDDTVLGRPH